METFSELQMDMNLNWLKQMRQCFWGYSYQTFIGGKNKFTPWHCGATAFFFIMVDGTKDWNLYPPNLYPLMDPPNNGYGYFFSNIDTDGSNKYVKPYRCTLEKGDILFIPAWMWHKVENKTDSWGISYRFVNIWGIITQPVFSTIRLFFTNPSFFSVMRNSLTSKPKKAFNLSPKLFGK